MDFMWDGHGSVLNLQCDPQQVIQMLSLFFPFIKERLVLQYSNTKMRKNYDILQKNELIALFIESKNH